MIKENFIGSLLGMSVVQTAFLFPRPTSLQYALRIGFPKLWWVIVSIHWEGSQTRVYFFCSNFEDNKTLFCSTESVKWKLSESLSMMISPDKKAELSVCNIPMAFLSAY